MESNQILRKDVMNTENTKIVGNVEETECSPDAARVMEGLRDTGYDFNTAIADIVDNSISANASSIDITLQYTPISGVSIYISDDGCGMNKTELQNAMKYGSDKRVNPKSLGKFGLGLKTASTAFCRSLSVVSRDKETLSLYKAQWDIDYIVRKNTWSLLWPEPTEDDMEMLDNIAKGKHGTLVIWEKVDRLISENTPKQKINAVMKKLEDSLRFHLAMTYQLFLDENCTDVQNISITLNHTPIAFWDPFCSKITGTELLLEITDPIELPNGTKAPFHLMAYILPGKNDFISEEDKNYAQISNDLQGFYVYRENRLIHYGDWMGMFTKEPHGSLLRIFLSFDNSLDDYFKVDIKKSRILMDDGLFDSLKNAISAPRREANERYRSGIKQNIVKGGQDAHDSSNNNIDSKAASIEASKVVVTDEKANQVEITNSNGTFNHTLAIHTSTKPGQYRVIPVESIEDGLLWNPCIVDSKHAVEINKSHPYYQKVYYPVLDQSVLVTGMDALLWALAEAELSTFNDDTREQYEDMRLQVSRCLKKLTSDLPEPEPFEESE
jgi:hypothetical protein